MTHDGQMRMLDVNVLVYAHRRDSDSHAAYAKWLSELAVGPEPFAVTPSVIEGVVRIVTNRRIFPNPSSLDQAFGFLHELLDRPNARVVAPGNRWRDIFEHLCRQVSASAKLVADAGHAATAIEHGCLFVSTDGDFARFPGLRWEHPLTPRLG